MIDARRKAYLQAMGIDLWALREPPPPVDACAAAPAVVEPPAEPAASASASAAVEEGPAQVPQTGPVDAEGVDRVFSDPSDLDWPGLEQRVAGCRNCGLCESRTQTVFGAGDQSAGLMLVGEAPGAEEDKRGEPFVGHAGRLLNAMLGAIGFQRGQVYITNVIKCHPAGNRDPHVDELAACQSYLNRQIELIRPRLVLALGAVSAKNLLATDETVAHLRGRVHQHTPTGTPLMVTYHPAYLMRRPGEKAKAWEDLQQVWRRLQESPQA